MILSLWFSPCWKVFCSLLSGDGSGRLDSWQTTSWANQLKTFIGDTFGMYKISSSNQKKDMEGEEMSGGERGGGGLKHFELHSAIGTKKQLSPVASAVKRWRESTKIIVTKWRKVHVNALTSNQAEEKMKPVDFYLFIYYPPFLVCQFCLPVIHFSSCLFCNIQRKKCLADQMKASVDFAGRTNGLIRSSDWRTTVPPESQNRRSSHLLLKWHQKKKAFSTCTRQPTESTEVILGGARAFFFFFFCCKHWSPFQKKKQKPNRNNKTYESNHNFLFFVYFFFFCLEIEPQENFTKVHISMQSHNVGSFKHCS